MEDITPGQCRAARAFLGWAQDDLAVKAKVAKKTIADFELGKRAPRPETLRSLRTALEKGGIEFLSESSGSIGVRLAASRALKSPRP
jgi:transcriptional regulator with XRE-family HTH domain